MFFQNIRGISVAVTLSNTKLNWKKAPFRTVTNDATQVGSVPSKNGNVARIRHDRTLEIAMGLRGSNGEKERRAA